jgi:hypothetical protein
MVKLRQHHKTYRNPVSLRWAGRVLILLLSLLVLFSIPLSAAHEITETRYPWETVCANGSAMFANQVAVQTVLKGYQSGVRESVQIVARSQSEWSALWKRHTLTEPTPPPLPNIDFSKEIVVAVFLGEKPTGGHDVEITRTEQNNDALLVSFVEKQPKPGGLATQAFTQPFHIVRIATQSSVTVSFRRLP